ncbi:MAG: hypothetical protein A2V77_05775 [Anaeromyxobacter sp. RBG_16_69_14]|nr:MAG: hypothetical protein A2V77_05775 [Anaeromyxobacter sp. RBG_16_69_14]
MRYQFVKYPLSFPRVPSPASTDPVDYMLYRLFTIGAAFTFGAIYLYLYFHSWYVHPFLWFGVALKYWAFAVALIALLRYKLPVTIFLVFGVSNLVVAALFTAYLVRG